MRPALFLSGSEITENFIIIHIKKDFLCGRENTGLWHTLELSNECQITVFFKKITYFKCTYQVSNFKAESKEVAYEKKRIWLKWQICEWQMTKKVC